MTHALINHQLSSTGLLNNVSPNRYQPITDAAEPGKHHIYRVIAVNTVGLKSKPSR